jgi:hypothetical protein
MCVDDPAPLESTPFEAWNRPCSAAAANALAVVCVVDGDALVLHPDTGDIRRTIKNVGRHAEVKLAGHALVVVSSAGNSRSFDVRTGRRIAETPPPPAPSFSRYRIEQDRSSLQFRDEDQHTLTMTEQGSGATDVIDEGYSVHPLCVAVVRDVAYVGEPDQAYNVSRSGVLVWAAKFRRGRLWRIELPTIPQSNALFPLMPSMTIRNFIPLPRKLLVLTNDAIHCLVSLAFRRAAPLSDLRDP